jgi:CheY-like chemotaxis protein
MQPERILVVEDDPDLQQNLRDLLEEEGYGVDSAFNGREALTFLKTGHRPAAILLDLMMPVMNGYQFLAALRGEQPAGTEKAVAGAIPTVVVSAAADTDQTSAFFGLPLVRKPFDVDVLLGAIRRAIGSPATG